MLTHISLFIVFSQSRRSISFITWDKVEGVAWTNYQPHNMECCCSSAVNNPKYVLKGERCGLKLEVAFKGADQFTFGIGE